MLKRNLFAALLLISATAAAPSLAQSPENLASKIVNDPGAPQVTGAKAKLRDDAKVQGGKALRIQVAGKGANAWDSFVSSPIVKPVKAGDQLVLAFWARLEKGDAGAAKATLPYNGVQRSSAPWTPLFNEPVEVTSEWKLHQVKGKADKEYAPGELNVTIHLATGRQTVDVGPIVVLNMGPSR